MFYIVLPSSFESVSYKMLQDGAISPLSLVLHQLLHQQKSYNPKSSQQPKFDKCNTNFFLMLLRLYFHKVARYTLKQQHHKCVKEITLLYLKFICPSQKVNLRLGISEFINSYGKLLICFEYVYWVHSKNFNYKQE